MSSRHFLLFFVLLHLILDIVIAEAYEGDPCNLHGVQGICKKLDSCPSAQLAIRNRESPPPPTCGYDRNDIIVCCKIVVDVLTTTKRPPGTTTTEYTPREYTYVDMDVEKRFGTDGCAPIPPETTSKPTGQKAWDKCLEYQEKYVFPCERTTALGGGLGRVNRCHHNADELVIGGTAAKLYEFTHMVLLGYQDQQGHITWQCGGSLISEKFVLTAGHCTSDASEIKVSHALVGVLKRSEETAEHRYRIKKVYKHGGYLSPYKYNDIALLELDRAVKLSHKTTPACLHTGDSVDLSRASATGWGSTVPSRTVNSDVLQKVILTRFEDDECKSDKLYAYHRLMKKGYQPQTQLCYGDRTKSQDTCKGDSGGPLQVKSKIIVCMYVIVGVTSFGLECGQAGVPSLYTRVAHYLPWIESIVWPDDDYTL